MIEQNSQEGIIFLVSKWDKFYVNITTLNNTNMMAQPKLYLSSISSDDLEEGIFEEFRENLKDSLSPRFSLFQNSEISQSILLHSMPQIRWCNQIFHLIISFFSHFSKWIVGVSIHVWTTISMRFDAVRLMVWLASAVSHPFLQMAPGCHVYVVCSCTYFCYEMHYAA